MEKIMRIGTVAIGYRERADIYVKAIYEKEKFSISGVIGPLKNGDALGGCGQIDMEFLHRLSADNDIRYSNPITPEEISFNTGWNKEKWLDLLDVWKSWHLNDLQAACEHQRALGWTYEDHHDKTTFKGDLCPVCNYSIGSQWLKKDVPQDVISFITSLPDTDKTPAWI